MKTYRELDVWNKSIELVEEIYKISASFPSDEKFGLTSQIRRAATSIPCNIAEGFGREHLKEYLHHLSMSKGSLLEVETQIIIAVKLSFVKKEVVKNAWNMSQHTGRMLTRLQQSLKATLQKPKTKNQSPKTK